MRVHVPQTVEVDFEKWAKEYGIPYNEVRDDVKAYFAFHCQEIVDSLGLRGKPKEKESE